MEKEEKYRLLTEQIKALVEGETDSVAVMANSVVAMVHKNNAAVIVSILPTMIPMLNIV